MLTLNLDNFHVELEDGSVKNVGPTNKSATAKLFHPKDADARAFGDSQVKITASDEEGNEVQVALDPEQAADIADSIEELREEGQIFD